MPPTDTFFVFGVRQWADGMRLESSAIFVGTLHEDGSLTLAMEDDDGRGAVFVLPADMAATFRTIHEAIFCGRGVMELSPTG